MLTVCRSSQHPSCARLTILSSVVTILSLQLTDLSLLFARFSCNDHCATAHDLLTLRTTVQVERFEQIQLP